MKSSIVPMAALAISITSAAATDFMLLDAGAPAKALIPSAANGGNAAGYVWQAEADPSTPPLIASWTTGTTGVGYDTDTAGGGNYVPHVGLDVVAMRNANNSVFIRIPFTVNPAQLPLFRSLSL